MRAGASLSLLQPRGKFGFEITLYTDKGFFDMIYCPDQIAVCNLSEIIKSFT